MVIKMLRDVINMMDELINDKTVPRNVKNRLEDVKNSLKDRKTEKMVRIGTAISVMDEISTDINLSMYARTKLWNIVSMLESMKRS